MTFEWPKQLRVFVVDDEYVIASTLAMILLQHGFDATFFTLPLEALQASDTRPPDLLICDVEMPLLSGIDLAIKVQERCPNCKVLLFSGHAATVDLLKAARANGYDFQLLAKPAHPSDVLKKIRDTVEAIPPALGL